MAKVYKQKVLDLSKKNQITEVYKYIQNHGSITDTEAHDHIGAERLGAIIYDLRHVYGINIVTNNITITDRYGTQKTIGKYTFGTNQNQQTVTKTLQEEVDSWFK